MRCSKSCNIPTADYVSISSQTWLTQFTECSWTLLMYTVDIEQVWLHSFQISTHIAQIHQPNTNRMFGIHDVMQVSPKGLLETAIQLPLSTNSFFVCLLGEGCRVGEIDCPAIHSGRRPGNFLCCAPDSDAVDQPGPPRRKHEAWVAKKWKEELGWEDPHHQTRRLWGLLLLPC